MVPLKIVSNVSRFKPAFNLNRVLADLNRGSNSLNSISDSTTFLFYFLNRNLKKKINSVNVSQKVENIFTFISIILRCDS